MQDNEKLRAIPKWQNPAVQHSIRGTVDGEAASILLPKADIVEIEADERAFYMFRYSNDGEPLGDSWFASLEEAFAQAEFEFGIGEKDWETLPNP